jgi:hypothetical protein
MDYLGKGEMLTNRVINKCVNKNLCTKFERNKLGTFVGLFISASRNMGSTLYTRK